MRRAFDICLSSETHRKEQSSEKMLSLVTLKTNCCYAAVFDIIGSSQKRDTETPIKSTPAIKKAKTQAAADHNEIGKFLLHDLEFMPRVCDFQPFANSALVFSITAPC